MDPAELKKLKQNIAGAIAAERSLIENLAETSKPARRTISGPAHPDGSDKQSRCQPSLSKLRQGQNRQAGKALAKIDQPGFGACIRRGNPIPPHGRIMALPENTLREKGITR